MNGLPVRQTFCSSPQALTLPSPSLKLPLSHGTLLSLLRLTEVVTLGRWFEQSDFSRSVMRLGWIYALLF